MKNDKIIITYETPVKNLLVVYPPHSIRRLLMNTLLVLVYLTIFGISVAVVYDICSTSAITILISTITILLASLIYVSYQEWKYGYNYDYAKYVINKYKTDNPEEFKKLVESLNNYVGSKR